MGEKGVSRSAGGGWETEDSREKEKFNVDDRAVGEKSQHHRSCGPSFRLDPR